MPPRPDPGAAVLLRVLLAVWDLLRGRTEVAIEAALVEGVLSGLLAPRRNGHGKEG
jgi:hypothetical protein